MNTGGIPGRSPCSKYELDQNATVIIELSIVSRVVFEYLLFLIKKYFSSILLTKKSNYFIVASYGLSPSFASNVKRM